MNTIDAMKQALDALTNRDPYVAKDLSNDAITNLRAAIKAMEDAEPVKCRYCGQDTMHMGDVCYSCNNPAPDVSEPLDLRQIYRGMKGIPHPAPAVPNAPQSFTCPSCGRHTWVKE